MERLLASVERDEVRQEGRNITRECGARMPQRDPPLSADNQLANCTSSARFCEALGGFTWLGDRFDLV